MNNNVSKQGAFLRTIAKSCGFRNDPKFVRGCTSIVSKIFNPHFSYFEYTVLLLASSLRQRLSSSRPRYRWFGGPEARHSSVIFPRKVGMLTLEGAFVNEGGTARSTETIFTCCQHSASKQSMHTFMLSLNTHWMSFIPFEFVFIPMASDSNKS